MRVGWDVTTRHSRRLARGTYTTRGETSALANGMARTASIVIAVPATATFVALSVAVLMGRAVIEAARRAALIRAQRPAARATPSRA